MRMGNLLCVASVPSTVMAATTPRLGVDHPTVVPADPDDAADADDEAAADPDDGYPNPDDAAD